jgi:hypothetical protein
MKKSVFNSGSTVSNRIFAILRPARMPFSFTSNIALPVKSGGMHASDE